MLQITGLHKSFGEIVAAKNVSLTVRPGSIVGFVGPNGAGKSTTMRSIFGLVDPDAGSITWNGEDVSPHLSHFGYMPEQRGLYPKMKIGKQVSFFAELKGVDRRTAKVRAEEILTSLGLGDRLADPLEKLSHGNQQRVQLAVSMVNNPDLLVLDEPFNGLDPVALLTLQDVLSERVRAGAGVLFSSHQLDLVERLCDEVVLIANGEVQAAGTVPDVRRLTGQSLVKIAVDRPVRPLDEVLGGFNAEAGTATATVTLADEADLARLLEAAQTSGGRITRFDYDLPSLEDVFKTLVGDPTITLDPNAPANPDTSSNTTIGAQS